MSDTKTGGLNIDYLGTFVNVSDILIGMELSPAAEHVNNREEMLPQSDEDSSGMFLFELIYFAQYRSGTQRMTSTRRERLIIICSGP